MKLWRFGLVAWLASSAWAGDWPRWRGPNGDGTSAEAIRTNWPATGPDIRWSAEVGTGFSSISISQGKAYTMGNSKDQDTVWCLEAATGKEIWRHTYPARLDPQYYEGGPGATPTVESNQVFTLSKWGDVFCLDSASGRVLWQRDLRQDGFHTNRWGFAGSPLLWRDRVILNVGTAGVALDRGTGRLVWSNGTNSAGYASPTLFKTGDSESVLVFAAKYLVNLEPATGKVLWQHRFETGYDVNNTDPVLDRGRIFISSYNRGCALLTVRDGRPEVLYQNKNLHNHLSPGILVGEYLYGFDGEAKTENDFRCLHLPTGELKWKCRDPRFGSLILAGGKLVVLSEKGELMIAEPSPEGFKPLIRAAILDGTCWTPPVLADGWLYARNAKGRVVCVDLLARRPH